MNGPDTASSTVIIHEDLKIDLHILLLLSWTCAAARDCIRLLEPSAPEASAAIILSHIVPKSIPIRIKVAKFSNYATSYTYSNFYTDPASWLPLVGHNVTVLLSPSAWMEITLCHTTPPYQVGLV